MSYDPKVFELGWDFIMAGEWRVLIGATAPREGSELVKSTKPTKSTNPPTEPTKQASATECWTWSEYR